MSNNFLLNLLSHCAFNWSDVTCIAERSVSMRCCYTRCDGMQGTTVFSNRPRPQISGFYDRDKELKQIQGVICVDNWLFIPGPRMVGKTSLSHAIFGSYVRKRWNVLKEVQQKILRLQDSYFNRWQSSPSCSHTDILHFSYSLLRGSSSGSLDVENSLIFTPSLEKVAIPCLGLIPVPL